MHYFAYGSNMSLARLGKRAPSARRGGIYRLHNHDLRFHKVSADGSGKCDAFETGRPDDIIIGCLFEISPHDKSALDVVEGLGAGYDEKLVVVVNEAGQSVEAVTYFATVIETKLRPYSWYLLHVVTGAIESNCPVDYVARIEATEVIEDRNEKRDAMERAIHG